ncbi:hypothetical protein D0Q02_07675 [Micromonospora craniellae]|uniref:Uncharacterized protein n=1 Tax=Micromonospora craniellae TaxID=2294034 RepID=A0A372G280_9ACTN|nr:hypothetical protein ID554_16760 [Micromonospora craniellae]RFS47165.1 hypothetical protein D0Q02_07675 [Micromonospora craniellae]
MYLYGGGPMDWAMDRVTVDGVPLIPQLKPGAVITCHPHQIGEERYSSLALADGTAVDQVTAALDGDPLYGPGAWPLWRGPALAMWISVDGGPRVYVQSHDLIAEIQRAFTTAQGAQAAASAAAAAAAELAGSSSVAGHLAAADPHAQYLNEQRGDARYLRAGDAGTIAPLDEVREKVTFSSMPPAGAKNMREVWVVIDDVPYLMAWDNEGLYPRRRQMRNKLFEHLYVGITAHNGTGRAFMVEQLDLAGNRIPVGGFDTRGRPVTSDQVWSPITSVDPTSTGDYSASTDVGPAPLGARWDTDDTVRLQGRITATAVTAGDALAELPAGFHPLSERLITVPTTTGQAVPCDLLPNGRIVARATVAGPCDLSLDDITYARIIADQETGDWGISTVAIATPGTGSPLTFTYEGVPGRLYLAYLSRSSAADPFTTVVDDEGNTWERVVYCPTSGGVGRRHEVWRCQPVAPFATVAPAFSGAGTAYATLVEVTGHNPATPIDPASAAEHRGNHTAPAPLQITPSGPGRLGIAAVAWSPNGPAQITVPAGWTPLPTHSGGPVIAYMTDLPVELVGAPWTATTGAGSGHSMIAINPA